MAGTDAEAGATRDEADEVEGTAEPITHSAGTTVKDLVDESDDDEEDDEEEEEEEDESDEDEATFA